MEKSNQKLRVTASCSVSGSSSEDGRLEMQPIDKILEVLPSAPKSFVVLRSRHKVYGKVRYKRVQWSGDGSELTRAWDFKENFPVNTSFIGQEVPVPGGIIYSLLKLKGFDRRILHSVCRASGNLREAVKTFNDWWRETYAFQMGRDTFVGIEKNPGPKKGDERRRPGAEHGTSHHSGEKKINSARKANRSSKVVDLGRLADAQQKLGEAEGRCEHLRSLLEERASEDNGSRKEGDQSIDPAHPVRSFKQLRDFTIYRGRLTVEMVYYDRGLSVPVSCRCPVECYEGWVATLYGADGSVEGSAFLNAAFLERMCDRGWGWKTQETKLSMVSFAADNPYPRLVDSFLSWDAVTVVKILDVILGQGQSDSEDYQEEVSSTWPGENDNVVTIYRKDLDIRHRARLLLPVADLPRVIFPVNAVELRRAADKRLTSKFNAENWRRAATKAFRKNSFWMQLHGNGTFEDVARMERPVQKYAEAFAKRKGLSQGQTAALIKEAVRIDEMVADGAQHDTLIKELRDALKTMKVFIKDESYEKRNTTLRFIVSPPVFVKLLFGCVFRQVEDYLYLECEALKTHHVKHLDSLGVRDRLMSMSASGQQVFYETDYSSYEVCQGKECLRAEYDLYESYYAEGSLSRRVIEEVARANTGDCTFLYNKNFRLQVGPMRWSGMPNTACGNLLMNVFNLVYAAGLSPTDQFICEGDDAIIVSDSKFGARFESQSCFAVTCDTAPHWSQLSFCGHAYDETGEKRVPDDDVMLARLLIYFTKQPLSLQKAYELLYLRFISFQLLYPSWPGFRDFAERCELVFAGRVKARISAKTYNEWFRGNWWKLTERLKMNPDFRAIPSPVSGRLFPLITDAILHPAATSASDNERFSYDDLVIMVSQAPDRARVSGSSQGPSATEIEESWGYSRYRLQSESFLSALRGFGRACFRYTLSGMLLLAALWFCCAPPFGGDAPLRANSPIPLRASDVLALICLASSALAYFLLRPKPRFTLWDPYVGIKLRRDEYSGRHGELGYRSL